MSQDARFKGLEIELHRFSGARVLRVVHPDAQDIEEHRHDCAYIALYTAGRYVERYDGGEAEMSGPCAVLHPAGRPHSDLVADVGLETLTIEFEPSWLRFHGFSGRLDRSHLWNGGRVGRATRLLASELVSPCSDDATLGRATARFLSEAFAAELPSPAPWLDDARRLVMVDQSSTADLARRFDLHPAYVAQAYRNAAGEGIGATLRRRRVEAASRLLRRTELPLAEIALAAGFCDQSHMNRCFSSVLGRTPLNIRLERQLFAMQVAGQINERLAG